MDPRIPSEEAVRPIVAANITLSSQPSVTVSGANVGAGSIRIPPTDNVAHEAHKAHQSATVVFSNAQPESKSDIDRSTSLEMVGAESITSPVNEAAKGTVADLSG